MADGNYNVISHVVEYGTAVWPPLAIPGLTTTTGTDAATFCNKCSNGTMLIFHGKSHCPKNGCECSCKQCKRCKNKGES